MPKINVYLPDDLAEAVREAGLPVSLVCQRALETTVRRVAAIRESAKLDLTEADPTARLENFTEKSRAAVSGAIVLAAESDQLVVGTRHLLAAMIDEGTNLAVQALRSMEIEPDDLLEDLVARTTAEGPADVAKPADRQLSGPLAAAMRSALNEAISMGHNYIGCEHLLLGLINEPDGGAGDVLRARGAEPKLARRAVLAMLSGFVYAKSQAPVPQQSGADALRKVLAQITKRLDRLEERFDSLGN